MTIAPKKKVLDFSFLEISDVNELPQALDMACPPPEGREGQPRRVGAVAVKVGNNGIDDLTGLYDSLASFIREPANLGWLDFSFNQIERIPQEFEQFQFLSSLYLQANDIKEVKALKPLQKCTNLKKLAMHGNPIEDTPNYRQYMMLLVPSLRMLDFSMITDADRSNATNFVKPFEAALNPRRRKSDDD
mmetsp:Transcript_1998/g.4239  ORF Transcript_1998/g.4239 Transcript_1998/m.4239 type:complete len:189 (+) Transcript_1998:81-647(+)